MFQEFVKYDEYDLDDYTVEMLMDFIEKMYGEDNRCKFIVHLKMQGSERKWQYKISCFTDYYRGQVVGIRPQGAKHGECSVHDPEYRMFICEMIRRGENAPFRCL